MQKVVNTYGTERTLVEEIVKEFTDALGWKVRMQIASRESKIPQERPTLAQEQQPFKLQTQFKPVSTQTTNITADILNGKKRNLHFGKYNWRALDVQADRVLIITEQIIEKRVYDMQGANITWENCALRSYLNNEFYLKLKNHEQAMVKEIANINDDNQIFKTKGGRTTTDKVFLLSFEDVVKYYGNGEQLQNGTEAHAKQLTGNLGSELMASYGGKPWWWLRTPGCDGISPGTERVRR